ncbi:MAG: hypothetical protein ACRCTX_24535 [Afipia sp.]
MTDHANELRRHARKIPHPQGETPGVMLRAADEIERLATKLEAAEKERDALRAKIETMEKQGPVATVRINAINGNPSVDFIPGHSYLHHNDKLYLAPGAQAQPAPSVPEVTDAMIEAIESRAEQSYRRHHGGARGQQIVPADALSWHIIHATRKVLSEAPEAKP